jgi:hypothetical protein
LGEGADGAFGEAVTEPSLADATDQAADQKHNGFRPHYAALSGS